MTIKKTTIAAGGGLVLVFALSLLFFFLFSYPRVGRIFFFPKVQDPFSVRGERHLVPRQKTTENNLEEYIREWLLGPLDVDSSRLFPPGTRLRSIVFRENTLYLDFSLELLLRQETVALSFREILDRAAEGISYNFPMVENYVFFIEGEQVEAETDEALPGVPGG